jgi:hypothetical protein
MTIYLVIKKCNPVSQTSANRGFLFSAIGDQYVAEAVQSARRLREVHDEEVGIALFTDQGDVEGPFTEVRRLTSPSYDRTDKISSLLASPFRHTIFLDTDTYAVEALGDIFDLLNSFDLAAAHTRGRIPPNNPDVYEPDGVPDSFPAYNTGVIAFSKNNTVVKFIREWRNIYEHKSKEKNIPDKHAPFKDQTPFREALFFSESIRVATLPPEYNFRFNVPGYAGGRVKILHGRSGNMKKVSKCVNKTTRRRVFLPRSVSEAVFSEKMDLIETVCHFVKMCYANFMLTRRDK